MTNARHDIPGVSEVIKAFIRCASGFKGKLEKNRGKFHYNIPQSMFRYNLREDYSGEFMRELTIPYSCEQMRMLLRHFIRFSEMNDVRLIDDVRFPENNTTYKKMDFMQVKYRGDMSRGVGKHHFLCQGGISNIY